MKIVIEITEKEIMEAIDKKKSTFFHWKRTRPLEYKLIRECLAIHKLQKKLVSVIDVP